LHAIDEIIFNDGEERQHGQPTSRVNFTLLLIPVIDFNEGVFLVFA